MKKAIAALAMTLAFSAQAEESGYDSHYEYCQDISELGQSIMEAHQLGVPMSKMMNGIGDSDMNRAMIRMAYDEPRYSTSEIRKRTEGKFRDQVYGLCLEGFDE